MANSWISHVKSYASTHGVKYGTAMKQAGTTYKGQASSTSNSGGRKRDAKGRYI